MMSKQIAERDADVKEIIEGMPLGRVREARDLTQQHLGHMLNKNQSAI